MYVDPNRNKEAGNLKWILPYCKPDLPRVVGAIVLFCVNNTMALIIPLLSGLIVDRVIVQGHVSELTRLCIMMIVFTIVRVTSRYGYQMWMERFGQNSVFRLVSDEYEKLHELDFTYFNHTRTGDIMSRMTSDTDAIRHALSWVSYQALDCVVMFVGALAMMFTIDWRLALALACITPFIFILTRGLSTHARPLFFAIRNSLAEMNSMVEENIEGNRVVKAFVREPYETEKFDERNDDYMQRNMLRPTTAANTCRGLTARLLAAADHARPRRIPGDHRSHDARQSRGVQLLPVDDRRTGAPIRMADQRLAAFQRILHQNPQTAHLSVAYHGKAGSRRKRKYRNSECEQCQRCKRCNWQRLAIAGDVYNIGNTSCAGNTGND